MLDRGEVDFVQVDPPFDDPPAADADLRGVEAAGGFARSLAAEKLASCDAAVLAAAGLDLPAGTWAVAADTVCVGADGRALGKPETADEAGAMLRGFVDAEHAVVTGLAIGRVRPGGGVAVETAWFELATVAWGDIDAIELGLYLVSGAWRGKSGGYNLTDRLEAGWPIEVTGDPDCVVGLPWRAVRQRVLNAAAAAPGKAARTQRPGAMRAD